MTHSLTGSRIREQRQRLSMSQTKLAQNAGISISYLNLIEHNKRRIAGKILLAIARELNTPVTTLTEEADSELTGALHEAAGYMQGQAPEIQVLAEFAGRYPGWSGLLTSLYRRVRDQEHTVTALSDRLTHDPFLAESLHLMLSNITAIRSTAGILNSVDDIPGDQQSRFHAAIHTESKRLSDATQALSDYFDKSADQTGATATPEEELDQYLSANGYCFPDLDHPSAREGDITVLLNNQTLLETTAARDLAEGAMHIYFEDAAAMPLEDFSKNAAICQYNPTILADTFKVSLHAVFRRLASLRRNGLDAPELGLIMVNAAGHAFHRRPLSDFPLPRHGNACPLWPLYQCFSQPNLPAQDLIELPNGKQFITLSVALPRTAPEFGARSDYQSAMLVFPQDQAAKYAPWLCGQAVEEPVGTSCRICPRQECGARSESNIC